MRDPWFAMVMALTVLVTVWLGVAGPLPDGSTVLIHKWQTLLAATVASLIASIAAYITFNNTRKTLRQTETLEKNRRHQKLAAIRAVMPATLAVINTYAEKTARDLSALIDKCDGETLPNGAASPTLGDDQLAESLKALADFIEYSDDVNSDIVKATVATIQIHRSRLQSIAHDNNDASSTRIILRHNIETLIVDAASIYAGASSMYAYSRRREDSPPKSVTWEDVERALSNMKYYSDTHDQLHKIVERRAQNSDGPFRSFEF